MLTHVFLWGFPGGTSGKQPTCQCRRWRRHGFHLWVEKIPWRRAWRPLKYSCLENPMDRGAWQTTVRGVAKRWTQPKRLSTRVYMSILISRFIPSSPFPIVSKVHSLCLRLYSCPTNRFISTIFLDSTYMF